MPTTVDCELCDEDFLPSKTPTSRPCLRVTIRMGSIDIANEEFAIVDTGSLQTFIPPELLPENIRPPSIAPCDYPVSLLIKGMPRPVNVQAVSYRRLDKPPLLIGRDVLQHYRFVYDPVKPEYSLTAA